MLTHRDMTKAIIIYTVKKNPLIVLGQLKDFFIYKLMEVLS